MGGSRNHKSGTISFAALYRLCDRCLLCQLEIRIKINELSFLRMAISWFPDFYLVAWLRHWGRVIHRRGRRGRGLWRGEIQRRRRLGGLHWRHRDVAAGGRLYDGSPGGGGRSGGWGSSRGRRGRAETCYHQPIDQSSETEALTWLHRCWRTRHSSRGQRLDSRGP